MDINKFARIAESLRQYRRAELRDFEQEIGAKPLDVLYVDPLPNDAVLNSVLSSNTTFVLGRKGTGKSTVFARAQSALRLKSDVLTTYIDVKSLYEITNAATSTMKTPGIENVDEGILRSHMVRKSFLGAVLSELLKEIDSLCNEMSLWDSWRGKKKSYEELKAELTRLQNSTKQTNLSESEIPILTQISRSWKSRRETEEGHRSETGAGLSASPMNAKVKLNASSTDFEKSLDDNELYTEYSEIVLRTFPFDEIISELRDLLDECDFRRIVVFFDDFSELSLIDQRLFVDVILAPLNNSSNESIKLKIAGYPGRVYYGKIDSTKVDTICLDFSSLYESNEVQAMEKIAIEYTKRLLSTRFSAFGADITDYFDPSTGIDDHMKLIFQTSFNVPRIIGSLLYTCYLDRITNGNTITPQSLRLAARKYYESVISQYFDRLNRFALEPFDNKLDRHNQEQLLNCVTREASELRKKIITGSVGGNYFSGIGNPPTSHFIVTQNLAEIFNSLEANFLISKYKDTRDKNGNPVVVFALFYGLTEAERFSWGYPAGREYRNYFVQRCFDFSSIIHSFLSQSQTIRCNNCGKSFALDQKESFELFKWRCPECQEGICSIVNLSDEFKDEVAQLQQDLMLEDVELAILNSLHSEGKPLAAGQVSSLIDVTYQLVGHRTSKLRDLGLVEKQRDPSGNRMRSEITEKAKQTYFRPS